ncbi:MAG: 2,3-bisphosphoglycerate-independent phosphoglycerate mutase, partial [Dehalococcoidia bacterium]|nr:2,3-bisphosphoglycerate-independent phosphoglycerate mutase [Dehalococcoidia bacterium]
SGPGHLALFGYDPTRFTIGRGVLEGMGIDFPLGPEDVAARGNFCTVDSDGTITDRRAGRISTEKSTELCRLLQKIRVDGADILVSPVKEHRFLVVFRGKELSPEIEDTDPGRIGVAPKPVRPVTAAAKRTAEMVTSFLQQARTVLANKHPANMILLRGFSKVPQLPKMGDVYKIRPAAVASYPMYKGLARLLGMTVFDGGASVKDSINIVGQHWSEFDYFFIHVKRTDAAGEDGDFARKVATIEEVDSLLPDLLALKPDVVVVTGDHSTPATLKSHSWHPVPFLISSQWCRPSRISKFGETACATGNLGIIKALDIMPIIMAHGLRLTKYGA